MALTDINSEDRLVQQTFAAPGNGAASDLPLPRLGKLAAWRVSTNPTERIKRQD